MYSLAINAMFFTKLMALGRCTDLVWSQDGLLYARSPDLTLVQSWTRVCPVQCTNRHCRLRPWEGHHQTC